VGSAGARPFPESMAAVPDAGDFAAHAGVGDGGASKDSAPARGDAAPAGPLAAAEHDAPAVSAPDAAAGGHAGGVLQHALAQWPDEQGGTTRQAWPGPLEEDAGIPGAEPAAVPDGEAR
jgi:hypothetical protein